MIHVSHLLLKILTKNTAQAIALFPFIFLKTTELKNSKTLINHERIHLRQQLELLIIPFYILYIFEYIIRRFQYKNHNLAYRNISFEREAYGNEQKLSYLQNRKYFAFIAYMKPLQDNFILKKKRHKNS